MTDGHVTRLGPARGPLFLATLSLMLAASTAVADDNPAPPPVAQASEDDAVPPGEVLPPGDALADRGKKKKSKPAASPARSGPDARPAPRPSNGDHARQPSPVQPRGPAVRPPGTPRLTPTSGVRGAPVRQPSQSVSAARRSSLVPRPPLSHAVRPYAPKPGVHDRLPWHSPDHRFARPNPAHLRPYPKALAPPPAVRFYRPWYAHWWVHPYWRYTHASYVVVRFDFLVYAWTAWWVPPTRPGWSWVPGYWSMGYWHPGHWRPVGVPPVYLGVSYLYVPGWWQGDIYVEGYWRPARRVDGDWVWIDGYYLDDGTYVAGHWRPAGYAPDGYVWEPGFFDGSEWVGGFWRPEYYPGYVWVSAGFDDDGVYYAGYWEPLEDRADQVWVPGWFDGNRWIQGYWVSDAEYQAADPESWEPSEGWDAGWEDEGLQPPPESAEELPLALPVQIEE